MGNNPVSDLIIGIDPGKTTGLAVLDGGTREMLSVHSLDFWGAIDYCLGSPAKLIVVELPDTKAVWSGKGVANAAAAAKVAVNVGGVLREAELMVDGLLHAGKTVITHHPLGKIDHKTFVRNTGVDRC